MSLERHADRKQPLVFMYNCTIGLPAYYSRRLEQEAKDFRDNDLKRIFEADAAVTAVWSAKS